METSSKLFPFLKKKFKKGKDSLITVRTYWDKPLCTLVRRSSIWIIGKRIGSDR
jgi:hypothetical protein